MTTITFFRIVLKKIKWLIVFPLLMAIAVVFFTRNMTKQYYSSTTVYTGLASGYNIAADGKERLDNNAVSNAFDNIIATVNSKETYEEAAMRLLAQHLLLTKPDKNILGEKGFENLKEIVPEKERKLLTVANDFEGTLKKIHEVKESSVRNIVQYALNNPGSFYSLRTFIDNVGVSRKLSSDMLEVSYTSSDPGVSLYALTYLMEVFKEKYKSINGGETGTAVAYFEDQLQKSLELLQLKENNLKNFGIRNNIIDYKIQTKAVADGKEDLNTEYYKEKMRYEAAKSAIVRIEEKMNNYSDFVSSNDDLVTLRQQLSNLNFKLSNAQLYKTSTDKIVQIKEEIEDLKLKLKEKARDYYNFNNSIEWVPQNSLLNEWLVKVVEVEESKGRLGVYQQRLKQYEAIYQDFAPLGSTVNKLEREIDVAEKQYLSVLNGLNLARLRQQNVNFVNSLKIIDHPFYPILPMPSKRLLYVALSFLAGFILLLSFYLFQEIYNNAIRYPEKVEELTGLPLLSALPLMEDNNHNFVDYSEVKNNTFQQILNSIFIELKRADFKANNYIIVVFSTKAGEGKTYFTENFVNKLCRVKNKVMYLYPNTSMDHGKYIDLKSPKILEYAYDVSEKVIDYQGIFDFISNAENIPQNPDEVSYTVLELPAINKYPIPANLIAKAHFNLMVVHAQRTWSNSDKHLLATYRQMATTSIKVLLNKVNIDTLESIYGEIPKNRSAFRRKVKSIIVGELA